MQPVQIKMARAVLGLSAEDLARHAGIPAASIGPLESGAAVDPLATQGLALFFAANGIELIDGDGVRAKAQETSDFVPVERLTTDNDGGEG